MRRYVSSNPILNTHIIIQLDIYWLKWVLRIGLLLSYTPLSFAISFLTTGYILYIVSQSECLCFDVLSFLPWEPFNFRNNFLRHSFVAQNAENAKLTAAFFSTSPEFTFYYLFWRKKCKCKSAFSWNVNEDICHSLLNLILVVPSFS